MNKFYLFLLLLLISYSMLVAEPFDTNLLKNPGLENNLNNWTVINGGNGWVMINGDSVNPSKFVASSYAWSTLSQEIDLIAAGFSAYELDHNNGLSIYYSQWMSAYWGGRYYIEVKALDGSHQLIYQSNIGQIDDPVILESSDYWKQACMEFQATSGMRYITYEVGGMDVLFWAGYYGTRIDDATLLLSNDVTGVNDDHNPAILKQSIKAFPNPFNPNITQMSGTYGLSKGQNVEVAVYNIKGQKVQTIETGYKSPGTYPISWNGKDDKGRTFASGIYFLNLRTGNYSTSEKIVIIK
ncbi:MAG TPA: FlgD immunoglobulin-like domain containing protein [Candidatus Cloacimonadota bacterium]|nr:FlgD immunoglobulin-like domain containing protein [Candidatus Cloacimonadota bacterium]